MSSAGRIRAMVVDDHPVMRSGLTEVLEASGRLEVVGEAGDGEEAVGTAGELKPQVIVMDVIMPRKDGVDACREIMELLPDTRVMMLTASTERGCGDRGDRRRRDGLPSEVLAAGGVGGRRCGCCRGPVADSRRGGEAGLRDDPRRAPVAQRGLASRRPSDKLSALERETLTLFASGRSYVEIAAERGNSIVTVRNTIYRIQDKLGIRTKQELVVWAVRNGLMDEVVAGVDSQPVPEGQ